MCNVRVKRGRSQPATTWCVLYLPILPTNKNSTWRGGPSEAHSPSSDSSYMGKGQEQRNREVLRAALYERFEQLPPFCTEVSNGGCSGQLSPPPWR